MFDDNRRPWVKVGAATADEVEAAVAHIDQRPEYEELVASGYRDR